MQSLLHPMQVIAAIEQAFARDYRKTVVMPTRLHLRLAAHGLLLIMPCFDGRIPALGIKLVTVLEKPSQPGDRIRATYFLLDPDTGDLRALLAANYLTDLRTAATSAVATKYLARPDAWTLGIFGTGRQARAHLLVLREVRSFRRFLVCGSSPQRSQEFARHMAREAGLEVEPVEAHTCAAESDVLCTCTNSVLPLFDGSWLPLGTHLNLVGAFRPDTREVDDETIRRARVVVDTYDGALAEAGDLLIPLRRGTITRDQIAADLHEITSGKAVGRQTAEDITVFKSVGCALEDLVTAQLVYEATSGGQPSALPPST